MKGSAPHLLLLAALLFSAALPAQRFKAGIVAGINMAQIDGDELAGYHQPGFNAGLRTSVLLSEKWQAGVELLFSQQGSDRVPNDPFRSIYDKIRLNMVEVPVMVMWSEWKLQLAAGLSYNRLINYRIRDIGGINVTDNFDLDNNGLSVLLGGTYFFQPQWGIDVRWTRAITVIDARSSLAGGTVDRFRSYFVSLRGLYLF